MCRSEEFLCSDELPVGLFSHRNLHCYGVVKYNAMGSSI